MGLKAVIIGGTGATGRELIGQLLENPRWDSILSLGRRAVDLPDKYKDSSTAKLRQQIVNMDNLAAEGQGAFENADVVFCTLGTTRGKAGSAADFVRVDLGYVREAAKLAKEANVQHFSLLTAQGANSRLWAGSFIALHPLLYARTKGEAEEAVKSLGFRRVSIFRPGLLNRAETKSTAERLLSSLVTAIPVSDVAQCMILDAERQAEGLQIFEMRHLLTAAKTKRAP